MVNNQLLDKVKVDMVLIQEVQGDTDLILEDQEDMEQIQLDMDRVQLAMVREQILMPE